MYPLPASLPPIHFPKPPVEITSWVTPTPNDVLCGRGRKNFQHPGNQELRAKIVTQIDTYLEASTRAGKTCVIRGIITSIMKEGGRFLRYDVSTKNWYDGGVAAGKYRVGIGLRDAVTPGKVNCIEAMKKASRVDQQDSKNSERERQVSSEVSFHETMRSQKYSGQNCWPPGAAAQAPGSDVDHEDAEREKAAAKNLLHRTMQQNMMPKGNDSRVAAHSPVTVPSPRFLGSDQGTKSWNDECMQAAARYRRGITLHNAATPGNAMAIKRASLQFGRTGGDVSLNHQKNDRRSSAPSRLVAGCSFETLAAQAAAKYRAGIDVLRGTATLPEAINRTEATTTKTTALQRESTEKIKEDKAEYQNGEGVSSVQPPAITAQKATMRKQDSVQAATAPVDAQPTNPISVPGPEPLTCTLARQQREASDTEKKHLMERVAILSHQVEQLKREKAEALALADHHKTAFLELMAS